MRNSFPDDPRDLEIENERLLEETDCQRRLLVAGIRLVTEISEIVRLPYSPCYYC